MFFPISRTVFRWSTPDPFDNWMMNGHLFLSEEGVILVDPPNVPGLVDAVNRLGGISSVILTTADHIRGSAYFAREFSASVFVPLQTRTTNLDPEREISNSGITGHKFFDENDELPGGLKPVRARVEAGKEKPRYDEMMLLSGNAELLAGDLVMGSPNARILTGLEFFYAKPDSTEHMACLRTIAGIIKSTGAISLLSSHGFDIIGNLQEVLLEKTRANPEL